MQIPRPVAKHRRHARAIPHGPAKCLQLVHQRAIGSQVGEQCEVVALMQQAQQRVGARRRKSLARRRRQRHGDAAVECRVWCDRGQTPRGFVLGEQPVGRVFRELHVGLIERIDREDRAGNGRGDFPAHELGAQGGGLRHVDRDDRHPLGGDRAEGDVARVLAWRAVYAHAHEQPIHAIPRGISERLAGDRHDAGTVLSRALGDELFDPEAERVERRGRDEGQLVPALERAVAHDEAERRCRVRDHRGCARLGGGEHRERPADDLADVLSHQRGRHHAEEGESRVTAADVGRVDEDIAELFGSCASIELGAFVGDRDEVIGPARHTGGLDSLAEMRGQRVRFDRRAGLARQHIQRGLGRRGRRADRGRIRRIEHLEAWPLRRHTDQRAEYLRRETRSAHAEQHDVGEAGGLDAVGECLQSIQRVGDEQRRVHPAEPLADLVLCCRIGAPDRRVRAPQPAGGAFGDLGCSRDPFGEARREVQRVGEARALGRDVERGPPRQQLVRAVHTDRIL